MTDSPAAPEGRWTAALAARRLTEVAREEGLPALWVKLLGEAGYRRLGIHELLLGPHLDSPSAGSELGFRVAGDDDRAIAGVDEGERRARIDAGHRCHLALAGGSAVGACWVARGSVPLPYLGGAVRLAPGEACTYETWTDTSMRGRGIGAQLRLHVAHDLRDAGLGRLLAMVYPENDPAVRMVEKLGYRRIGAATVLCAGAWSRLGMRMERGEVGPGKLRADSTPAHGRALIDPAPGPPRHRRRTPHVRRLCAENDLTLRSRSSMVHTAN